jgi:hypothetical protein
MIQGLNSRPGANDSSLTTFVAIGSLIQGEDSRMRRREFIAGLGSAAAWPMVARAQQQVMPVIGYLAPQSLEGAADDLRAFRQGLKDTGYIEGENVAVVYRFANNQVDRLSVMAAELVRPKSPSLWQPAVPRR